MSGLSASVPLLGTTSALAATGGVGNEREIIEGLGVTYRIDAIRTQQALATGGIGMHATLTPVRGVVLLEQLRISLAQVANSKTRVTLNDAIGLAQHLLVAVPVTVTAGIGIALTQQAQLSLRVIEGLGIQSVVAPMFKYHRSLSETIGVASVLAKFLGGELIESINIASLLDGSGIKPGAIVEGIGVSDVVVPRLIMRVTAVEDISIEDSNVLQMLFNPVVTEGIEIAAAYLSPGDSVVTWAMNTRTGAVTEYDNYVFNSFAQLGDKYIGASEDGLFELLGDDDAGEDIIAHIKTGFAQWAGSKFAIIKGIYMAVSGAGDYILKIVTGDGKTYVYQVSARGMQTTRIHTGKGLKARYFSFELISTGQDFDLDTLEFVPLVSDRRV